MKGASIDFLTILAITIVLALAFFATSLLNDGEKTVKIGFIAPLTGYAKTTGLSVKQALDTAVGEINAGGGIGGKKLELVAEDGKCSYPDAQEAARRLFASNVPVIIGGVCETEAMGAASVIGAVNEVQPEGKKVLLFAPCSSNSPGSTLEAIRLYPFDASSYGAASADLAYNRLGAKTAAAILRCGQAWCSELAVEFKKKFTGLGGTIAFEATVAGEGKSENEFVREAEPKLTGLGDSGARLVYVIGNAPYVLLTSALMKKLNVSDNVEILATASLADPQILQNEKLLRVLPDGAMMAVLPLASDCSLEAREAAMLLASSIDKSGGGSAENSTLIRNALLEGGDGASRQKREYTLKTLSELIASQ